MDLSQPVSHRVPACLEKMPGKQQGDTKHRTISPKSGPLPRGVLDGTKRISSSKAHFPENQKS